MFGTMIEIPRACMVADQLAEYAQFFSFGTNDLTQMTFGYSRDDSGKFLLPYVEQKILPIDPSSPSIGRCGRADGDGRRQSQARPADIKLGICGEHGGDPEREVLPRDRPELRLLLPVPRSDRPACRRAGCYRRRQRARQVASPPTALQTRREGCLSLSFFAHGIMRMRPLKRGEIKGGPCQPVSPALPTE